MRNYITKTYVTTKAIVEKFFLDDTGEMKSEELQLSFNGNIPREKILEKLTKSEYAIYKVKEISTTSRILGLSKEKFKELAEDVTDRVAESQKQHLIKESKQEENKNV